MCLLRIAAATGDECVKRSRSLAWRLHKASTRATGRLPVVRSEHVVGRGDDDRFQR
jgi:hypothetical protein